MNKVLSKSVVCFAYVASIGALAAQVDVLTKYYNVQRTGTNLAETDLTPSNVQPGQFGKLFQVSVDDQVYAGTLYVSALPVGGATHNVLFVATVKNSVYAFDADTGAPLWQRNFNGSGRPSNHTEVGLGSYCGNSYNDFSGNIGIVGTPVIDRASRAMYFVTRTVEGSGTVQRLRSIDITTGFDRANSPHVIQASVPGTGEGGSTINFNSKTQNQRPALALSSGVVYVAWASYCDTTPFHGWVMGFDANSLALTGVINTSPQGTEAGIWMGSAAPAIDANGNLFYSTGNGTADGLSNFGMSVIKLAPRTLSILDLFTESDYANLNVSDTDLGSSGPTLLPGSNMMVQGSKQGLIFLLNSLNLGHISTNTQIPQVFQAVNPQVLPLTNHIHNANVVWNSPNGLNLYVWGENDYLRSFRFNGSTFNTTAQRVGSVLPPAGMPGGMMTLTANGSTPGTGILWATTPLFGDANHSTVPGILYAFNAETLALLWSSSAAADNTGNFAKFNNPIVANGKVYVASFSNKVTAYGLYPTSGTTTWQMSINAGGQSSGSFLSDTDFAGGIVSSTSSPIDTTAVSGPAPQSVYQNQRFGNFSYLIVAAPNSNYTIRLHFAETYWTGPGQRSFDVSVNGKLVLNDFDIAAAAGGASKAVTKQFTTTTAADGNIVIQFTSVRDNAALNGIEINPNPAPPPSSSQVVSVNSGGGASASFGADSGYNGGIVDAASTNSIDTSLVTNPAPQAVYQTERYGNFTYTFSGLTSGATYTARLHFAEYYWSSVGQRVFNVSLNGASVLQNFDIIQAAGGANRAIAEQFTATATSSGQIVLQFTTVTDGAKVSGIELTSTDSGSTQTPSVTPVSITEINSGSAAAAGDYISDQQVSGGTSAATTNTIDTSTVLNPAPQAVYQSERFGNFTYTIPGLISGSSYVVRLHFAEFFWTAAGQRVFNVAINGTNVLDRFDIIAAAGAPNRAMIKRLVATANSSGQLVIQFTSVVDNAKLSGMEVLLLGETNAGGSSSGSFASDSGFSGGLAPFPSTHVVDTSRVSSPPLQDVYQSERFGNFTYTVSGLKPGKGYGVRLHFAEVYWTAAGQRLFNVNINGASALTNFDIIALAGAPDRAVVQSFTVVASASGQIVVQFVSVKDNAKLSGLELIP